MNNNNEVFDLDILELISTNIKYLKTSILIIILPIIIFFIYISFNNPKNTAELKFHPNIDNKWQYSSDVISYFENKKISNLELLNFYETRLNNRFQFDEVIKKYDLSLNAKDLDAIFDSILFKMEKNIDSNNNIHRYIMSITTELSPNVSKKLIEDISKSTYEYALNIREISIQLSIDTTRKKIINIRENYLQNLEHNIVKLKLEYDLLISAEIKRLKYEHKKLENNYRIAEKLGFVQPQTDLLVEADLKYRVIVGQESNSLKQDTFMVDEEKNNNAEIPLYMYGTQIISEELSNLKNQIDALDNNTNIPNPKMINITTKIIEYEKSKLDLFVPQIIDAKKQLKYLLAVQKEVNDNKYKINPIIFYYDTINTKMDGIKYIYAFIISSIMGLFASIIFINFYVALRKRILS